MWKFIKTRGMHSVFKYSILFEEELFLFVSDVLIILCFVITKYRKRDEVKKSVSTVFYA